MNNSPSSRFYSDQDKQEWLQLHHLGKSFRDIAKIFKEKYPGRFSYPNQATISRLVNKFNKSGSIKRKEVMNKKKTALTGDKVIDILAEISVNPIQSTRKIADKSGISKSSVHYLLKTKKFKPYKLRCVQPLYGQLHFLIFFVL